MSINTVIPIYPNPGLLIQTKDKRVLVVGDLHIGWEISLLEKGIHIPPQVWRITNGVLNIVREYIPDQIILLGDIKHTIPKISLEEWTAVPEFFENVQKMVADVTVITGNHDGGLESLIPPSVKIIPSTGLVVGKKPIVGLFHGHAWPAPEVLTAELLIMSHVHPIIWFRDKLGAWMVKQVWIKGRCNSQQLAKSYLTYLNVKTGDSSKETLRKKLGIQVNDASLIIMPTFNDLVGGVSLNRIQKRLLGPLLGSGSVNLAKCEVYLLDGTFLGTMKQVQTHLDATDL
jgi:putative SbcD/Mre11-related phosphoesterase